MKSCWSYGLVFSLCGVVLSSAELAIAQNPGEKSDAEQVEFFELQVRPLLIEKCIHCHSGTPDAESVLAFGSRQALLKGGDFGPAIVPGRADDSLLIQSVKRIHKELRMPPEEAEALSRDEVDILIQWVNDGAVWGPESPTQPASQPNELGQTSADRTLESDFWSLQPVKAVEPPHVEDARWSWSQIDRFVEAARREHGLTATSRADRRTLLRRATFDLTGLPPEPKHIDSFLNDEAPGEIAFARVVDRLLASPQYGERQGRLWLDVARYADTQGDVGDFPIPDAWRYRNWVIDALNADLPYDQFLQAQIAGDILAASKPDEQKARGLVIATGFVALSRRFGNTKQDDLHLTIEDTLDTIGRGVLGLTLRCARCHDHKFDPLLMTDYYGLYGIFESTRYPWMGASNEKSPSALAPALPSADAQKAVDDYWRLIERYEYQINNHFRPWLKPTLDEYATVTKQLAELRGPDEAAADSESTDEIAKLEKRRDELLGRHGGKFRELMLHDLNWVKQEKAQLAEQPTVEFVFAVSEGSPHDAKMHRRGNPQQRGDVTPRRFLQVIDGPDVPEINHGSGRLELARWLTQPDHPLTPRVVVSRIWQQHFGRGLVATSDNFGKLGMAPSHPELLDWLAATFVADGWSLKKLHRRILLSETYALSSEVPPALPSATADPDNVFLWKHPRRRLDAESIRDAMLAVSGTLDHSQGKEHPFKPWHATRFSLNKPFHEDFPSNRRSVYLMTQRLFRHPFLGLFDGPDRNSSTSQRTATNVPGQALFLMNSPFVKEQAAAFARRIETETRASETATDSTIPEPDDLDVRRLDRIYQLAFGRNPMLGEQQSLLQFLQQYRTQGGELDDGKSDDSLLALCRAVLTSNEFFFVD
ncbi:DUF1553 domain-containing protein [bacterium]|nr:DUF1553 domain-containing protein [bacterium]